MREKYGNFGLALQKMRDIVVVSSWKSCSFCLFFWFNIVTFIQSIHFIFADNELLRRIPGEGLVVLHMPSYNITRVTDDTVFVSFSSSF